MAMKLKQPLAEGVLPASEMHLGALYWTAKSPEAEKKRLLCRLSSMDYTRRIVILSYCDPYTNEWRECPVEWDYPVQFIKEEEEMKLKKDKAASVPKAGKVQKTKGVTSGVGVFETWAIAFAQHGETAASVVAFMKSEYPNRKTDWAKWVNGMRQRYNRGALTGGKVPEKQLPKYVEEKPKKKTSKEK